MQTPTVLTGNSVPVNFKYSYILKSRCRLPELDHLHDRCAFAPNQVSPTRIGIYTVKRVYGIVDAAKGYVYFVEFLPHVNFTYNSRSPERLLCDIATGMLIALQDGAFTRVRVQRLRNAIRIRDEAHLEIYKVTSRVAASLS